MKKKIFCLLDLTSLNDDDTPESIEALCKKAQFDEEHVAAICIYPKFLPQVRQYFPMTSPIKIASVCNFPEGKTSLVQVLKEIEVAIYQGADELDIVMPYHQYLAGKYLEVQNFISECKKACGNKALKIILETGALKTPELIKKASQDAILAGADFIKTSTGKIAVNATLDAAKIMFETIRECKTERPVGFKAAGGIRTLDQAISYLKLAEEIMGPDFIQPDRFRLGASKLIDEIIDYSTVTDFAKLRG